MPFLNEFGGNNGVPCGLVYFIEDRSQVPVPLKKVALNIKVLDFVADVRVEQEYINVEDGPIEASYLFPVEEEAAIVDFKASVDDREIKTIVKKKEVARKEYREAINKEKTAFLLEGTKADVFQIKVGHLKPGAGAKVVINYITELPVDEYAVRLTVPTTIAPRYAPVDDKTEATEKLSGIKYSTESPAPLGICIATFMKGKIKSIKSPTHHVETAAVANEKGELHCNTFLKGTVCDMDRDLVVLIEAENIHDPVAYVETSSRWETTAGMVSLVPQFRLGEEVKSELIFLIDRSGSMTGHSIRQAKDALTFFLHSLPAECYFNIFSFGCSFDSLYHSSSLYNDETLRATKSHVSSMSANYGGTEIYAPLEAIFNEKPKEGHLRQVFVLTDGAVTNEDQVIDLVKRKVGRGRVFALGLGDCASRHLIKGVARAGNGIAVFATTEEDLRPKVLHLLQSSLQPAIDKVNVEWINDLGPVGPETSQPDDKELFSPYGQAPMTIPPIFDGQRLLAYRLFNKEEGKPVWVRIVAESPDGPLSIEIDITGNDKIRGDLIHQLAARKRIQELDEAETTLGNAERIKEAVGVLGESYSLVSSQTSFIGIDSKIGDKHYCEMESREITNQIPLTQAASAVCYGYSGRSYDYYCEDESEEEDDDMGFDDFDDFSDGSFLPSVQKYLCVLPQSPESESKPDDEELISLVSLQLAEGNFKWGTALEKILGKKKEDVKIEMSGGDDEDVWVTAIALAVIEKRFGKNKEIWKLVAEKAKKFLAKKNAFDMLEKARLVESQVVQSVTQ